MQFGSSRVGSVEVAVVHITLILLGAGLVIAKAYSSQRAHRATHRATESKPRHTSSLHDSICGTSANILLVKRSHIAESIVKE